MGVDDYIKKRRVIGEKKNPRSSTGLIQTEWERTHMSNTFRTCPPFSDQQFVFVLRVTLGTVINCGQN